VAAIRDPTEYPLCEKRPESTPRPLRVRLGEPGADAATAPAVAAHPGRLLGLVLVCAALTWQGMILDLLGQREEALALYRQALTMPGQTMVHSQYQLRIDKAWVEQRLQAPFQRD